MRTMFVATRRFLLPLLVLLGPGMAAERAPRSTIDDQDAVSVRGVFDFPLPKLIRPESLRFTLHPQFGDVVHRDYLRLRTGVRYAFNEHLEAGAEIVPFLDNFGGGGRGGGGIAEYRLGAKLAWRNLLRPYADTAFGVAVAIPAPGAPEDLTIGTTRCSPYVTFSRDLRRMPGLGSFLTVGYEFFDTDPASGRIARYRPQHDNLSVTPGIMLHRAPWHYTLASTWRSTVLAGGAHDYVSLLPSISYEVPARWFPSLPGRVVVGAGYEAIFFGGETEHRFTTRLRWDFDWARTARNLGQEVLGRMPWRRDSERR